MTDVVVNGVVLTMSGNGAKRLERVMELRKTDINGALDYVISVGWLVAENRAKSWENGR
jgi:hypothetical protein